MTTGNLTLSVREALESSISFATNFFKRHWVIGLAYVILALLPSFITKAEEMSMEKLTTSICFSLLTLIPGLFLFYFSYKEALLKIDPQEGLANRSMGKSILQIILMTIILSLVSIPLFILFVVPAIWWSTKTSVAFANLLDTDDGVIKSIKKSHELMNGRFWECFGFLLATTSAVLLAVMVIFASVAFFVIIAGVLIAIFNSGGGTKGIGILFNMFLPLMGLFSTVIFYYLQTWLYVYLKQQSTQPAVTAIENIA